MSLIRRTHEVDGVRSSAIYSECERYRYTLAREWSNGPRLTFIMLNPSKATEAANDPTIERCQRRAVRLGFGAMRIANIFAWRETDPGILRKRRWPEGPDNTAQLLEAADWADVVLAAWGVHGAHRDQGRRVADLLTPHAAKLRALGVTKDGHPRHPLYCAYDMPMRPWTGYPPSGPG